MPRSTRACLLAPRRKLFDKGFAETFSTHSALKHQITGHYDGTVQRSGELPRRLSNGDTGGRIGEFVYYVARDGEHERHIIGNITSRKLVRNLPDVFLSDPEIPPSVVSSLIGLDSDCGELYEITVETVGYFSSVLGDFVNPRIPPNPGDPVFPLHRDSRQSSLPAPDGRDADQPMGSFDQKRGRSSRRALSRMSSQHTWHSRLDGCWQILLRRACSSKN